MEIVVEALAFGVDAPNAVSLEDRKELAFGRLDAFEKALRALVPGLLHGQAVERSAQIVRHREQLFGEARNRIFRRIFAFALATAADVLSLCERPQQAILLLGKFRFECGHAGLGREFFRLRSSRLLGGPFGVVVRRCLLLSRPLSSRHCLLLFSGIVHRWSYPIRRPITLAV